LAGFPAVGDVRVDGVTVRGFKTRLPCGSTPQGAKALVNAFSKWLPDLLPTTAAEAELNSTNVLLHGPLLLPHLAQMASTRMEPDLFYRPPALTCAAPLAEQVDKERVELGRGLGLSLPSGLELLLSFYGDQGMTGRDISEALNSFEGFGGSRAPSSFNHRYVTDDVGFGLACWTALGSIIDVPMPVTSALVETLSRASGLDLAAHALEMANSFLQAHRVVGT
jgi:opine dehydrogenase